MDGSQMAYIEAMVAFIRILIWFSGGWFVAYGILGAVLKVKLTRWGQDNPKQYRWSPVVVLHLLFCLIWVNPMTMFKVFGFLQDHTYLTRNSWLVLTMVLYFAVLPMVIETAMFRWFSRWKYLQWFSWRPSWLRFLLINIIVSGIGFGGGFLSVQMKDYGPMIVRMLPIHPKNYAWKITTYQKPLPDASVTAGTESLFTDGKRVFVQTQNRGPEWTVFFGESQGFTVTSTTTIAFVLTDDGQDVWEISEKDGKLCFERYLSQQVQKTDIPRGQEMVFGHREVQGMIIGADSNGGTVYAFSVEDGHTLWKAISPYPDKRIGNLVCTNDLVIAGQWTSSIWAVDLKTGQTVWRFQELGIGNSMHVVASDNYIGGFSVSGMVFGFEAKTGKEMWKKNYGSLAGNIGMGNACIEDRRLFFRDENTIKCVDITNGDLLWTVNFGTHYSGGISSSDEWVACSSDRSMIVLDAKTGNERFQTCFPVGQGRKYGFSGEENCPATLFGNPYIQDDFIYVFAGDGTLWVLNL